MSTSARLVADATMDPSSRYPSPPLSPPNRHSTSSDLLLSLPSIPPFDPSRYRAESMQRSQSDQQHSYHPPPHHQQLLSPPEQRPPRNGRPTSNNNGPPPSSSSSSSARPASKKRASHNPQSSLLHPSQIPSPAEAARRPRPSAGPHGSSSSASVSLADLSSVHPAVAAYQAEHPRRQLLHFGRYVLLQTLGEGEFGKVKLGVHSEFGEEVAVKLIKKGNLDSEVRASKVEREIDVLRLVKHPNIVRLFDVIETEKYIGIILEYANGGELFDHILAHRYLKERDASKLFAQLVSGVHYLHSKNIVHRDLKLENLLLDKARNVIITDFGFANKFEQEKDDLMSTSCGSPCYAAPELVVSEGMYVGSAVDIWSCGVILYAMLSGYLPFDDDPANPDGDNINQLYRYIINTPLSFPSHISPEARHLLSIMLVPDPLRRATLPQVMSHPWLAAHRALFVRSVESLEALANAEHQEKRQQSRREMQARAAAQKQAMREAEAAASGERNSKIGRTSSRPGTAGGYEGVRVKANRYQSALPTTTTMPDVLAIDENSAVSSAPGHEDPSGLGLPSLSGWTPGSEIDADPFAMEGAARGEPRRRTPSRPTEAEEEQQPHSSRSRQPSARPHTLQVEYDAPRPSSSRVPSSSTSPAQAFPSQIPTPTAPISSRSRTTSTHSVPRSRTSSAISTVSPVLVSSPVLSPPVISTVHVRGDASQHSDVSVSVSAIPTSTSSPVILHNVSPSHSSASQSTSQDSGLVAPLTPADELMTLKEDVQMANPNDEGLTGFERREQIVLEADGVGLGIIKGEPGLGSPSSPIIETGLPTPEPSKIHTSPTTPPMAPESLALQQELNSITPKAAPAAVTSVADQLSPPETPKAPLVESPSEEVPAATEAQPEPTAATSPSPLPLPPPSASLPTEAALAPAYDLPRPPKSSTTSSHLSSSTSGGQTIPATTPTTSSFAQQQQEKPTHARTPSKTKNRMSALGSLLGANRSVLGLASENGNGADVKRSDSKASKKDRRQTLTMVSEGKSSSNPRTSVSLPRPTPSSSSRNLENLNASMSSSSVNPNNRLPSGTRSSLSTSTSASTGPAKKVMDWFRRRSVGKSGTGSGFVMEAASNGGGSPGRGEDDGYVAVTPPSKIPRPSTMTGTESKKEGIASPSPAANGNTETKAKADPPSLVVTDTPLTPSTTSSSAAQQSSNLNTQSTAPSFFRGLTAESNAASSNPASASTSEGGSTTASPRPTAKDLADSLAMPPPSSTAACLTASPIPATATAPSPSPSAFASPIPTPTPSSLLVPTSLLSTTQATFKESLLRYHQGVLDKKAVTSEPAVLVWAQVIRVLGEMGIEMKKEKEFRIKCTRTKRNTKGGKESGSARGRENLGLGLGAVSGVDKGSLMSGFSSFGASSSTIDKRGLLIPTSPSGSLLSSSGLKNLMMRRGSSYSTNTIHSTLAPSAHTTTSDDHPNTLTPTITTNTNTEPFSPSPAPGGAGAMQPDPEKDSGDEVKFTVELTRIMNLPGLYSIDLKRQKGPLWTYAWIYQRLFEAVEEKKMLAAAAA